MHYLGLSTDYYLQWADRVMTMTDLFDAFLKKSDNGDGLD